ncbi:OLC1v1010688C1 [Oldenlandia corymbosa var. corymbosa]|uniref:Protein DETOXIFICATION n=1 Tax=Oldenlandia corymbosa var. corymbosa TaxID=529605 RepID=A0AAV1DSI0_OLDCO|nr:OLC1v1010688C1 [Oldenlandia corymbosa var. corymbosa]
MEEAAAIPQNNRETGEVVSCKNYMEEFKKVNAIAMPMIAATVAQYLLRVSPIFMVGHLGQLQLSSVSIATSFSNVSGFSVLFGMSTALETLCGQAFGARQYHRLGAYTYGAIICLFIVCLPIILLWVFTDKLLILTGQDPTIATEARKYLIWLIPTLFPYAILQSLVRFLQTQSLITPILLSSVAALAFQVPLCWILIFKLKLGIAGAASSISISYWLYAIFLGLYVKCSPACKETRVSTGALNTFREFFRFAIPSVVMLCLEWWAFELVILLSGLSPNPKLEASVLSICYTMTTIHGHIPYSFAVAVSTRVANELGAGNPRAAKVAVSMVLMESVTEFVVASIVLFLCRSRLGHAFSDEKQVIHYVKKMTPLLCLSILMDGTQVVLSGVARGSGWQRLGAYVNLGSYYLVGIPVALVLGFALHLRGIGLWGGLVSGTVVQAIIFLIITALTNWEKQATEARKRIFEREEEKEMRK